MPFCEAPCEELGAAPRSTSGAPSPAPSEVSSASTPDPQHVQPTALFRALAMAPPEPEQPPGQDELERRVPGYRRIVIPRELTLIELLKQSSGVDTDEEVLRIREAKLRVVADRVGLRRLHVLAPCLSSLTLDGSVIGSLRDLGIGLVHLKILRVNRCGLTTLDGVWGLGALRELYAAGNRLQDLQPLAALQKLHTLDLADNPISDVSRLWTLGVCTSLRHLTLQGTSASDNPDYRPKVANALPMLTNLDGHPLHNDSEDDEYEGVFDDIPSESDFEDELDVSSKSEMLLSTAEPEPGPSTSQQPSQSQLFADGGSDGETLDSFEETRQLPRVHRNRRPATTEGAGLRPLRPNLPPRPKTAQERSHVNAPSKLKILNTLLDDEWRSCGSNLTSRGTVCGNIAQALRRPTSAQRYQQAAKSLYEAKMMSQTISSAARTVAAEIPMAPRLADWAKFKENTGIDIDIDFDKRPTEGDALSAIERLERIEKETSERLSGKNKDLQLPTPTTKFACAMAIMNDIELWKEENLTPTQDIGGDAATLFDGFVNINEESLPD